jgi:hypothetical protein
MKQFRKLILRQMKDMYVIRHTLDFWGPRLRTHGWTELASQARSDGWTQTSQ